MKKHLAIFIFIFTSSFYEKINAAPLQTELVSGLWKKSESPYIIENNISIASGDTLIIEPGVKVLFAPGKSLLINGTLKAIGTPTDSIFFTSKETNQYWGIILFQNKNVDLSEMQYCIIENGSNIEDLWEWGAVSIAGIKTTVSHCLIKNNKYDGIWCAYEGNQPASVSVSIFNNVIKENGRYGIFTAAIGEDVFKCQKNMILRNGLDGIKLWLANGIFTNNTIAGNSGHGIFCYGSNVNIDLNTVTNNSGMGVYCDGNSNISISNSIIFGNRSGSIDVKISEISVSYSDVQDFWDGLGNISADPKFVDPEADNYNLLPSSPCIDSGNPLADYSHEPEPNGHVVNLGAYGNINEATHSVPNSPEILVKYSKLYIGVAPVQDSVSTELVIRNLGDAVLSINKLECSTINFTTSTVPIQISPHDSATLLVFFKPTEHGENFFDTLKIFSNDNNESPTYVLLEGRSGTYISGEISGVWTLAKSPYIIQDIVTIPTGTILTIEPGVIVKFKTSSEIQKGATLKVNGTLIAVGTPNNKITFTRLGEEGWWGSILLQETGKSCRLEYCTISYGSGTQLGSYSSDAAVFSYNSITSIKNSLFINNVSGLCLWEKRGDDYAVISGNTFTNNSGYALINQDYNTIIKNNIFLNNNTGIATMVYAVVENNTVVHNQTGLWLSGSSKPIVKNCVVWNNKINVDDKNIDYAGKAVIMFSDVQGGWEGYGNIDLPPLFGAEDSNNYHLQSLSPCIDGGDPKSDYSMEPLPNGGIVNMGAYGNTTDAEISQDNSPEILITNSIAGLKLLSTHQKDSVIVTIRNIGKAPLHIQNLIIESSVFSCSSKTAVIEAKDSLNLLIFFQSQIEGDFSDTLWIYNDDLTESKSFVLLQAKTTSGLFGDISGTFSKGHGTYLISSTVTVPANKTLILEPGTRLEMKEGASIFVNGTLTCVGTTSDSIVITTNQDNKYWGGIYFGPNSGKSQMKFTVVENGKAYGQYYNSFFGTLVHLIACENAGPIFTNNTIRPIGVGGILVQGGNATITDNQIIGGAYAGIRSTGSNSTILRNFVSGNEHHGISIDNGGTPTVSNNVLINNGNGIYCSDTRFSILNNTILYNNNSGIMCFGTSLLPVIKNNIIWQNNKPFYLYGGAERAEIDITYNDIEGGWSGYGNINVPPLFLNAEEHDFHLLAGSPCVDAGDPDIKYNDAGGTRNDIGATGGSKSYYIVTDVPYSHSGNNDLPRNYYLFQNYPNPFNPTTVMNYQLPEQSHVSLKVYDMLGREVETLVDEMKEVGYYTVTFNAAKVSSGIYFSRMTATRRDGTTPFTKTMKMQILK